MTRLIQRHWTIYVPIIAVLILTALWTAHPSGWAVIVPGMLLLGSVLAAVHHAEVIAERVGEPFGSLILAIAVTTIEVGLIVTLMLDASDKNSALARDTIFAAIMICCNGIVGLCLIISALRQRVATFNAAGSRNTFGAILTLSFLALALPTFTEHPGPRLSTTQLTSAAAVSLVIYVLYVFTQTVRHRDYFLPVGAEGDLIDDEQPSDVTTRAAQISTVLLMVALISVVGLAKLVSPTIEDGVSAIGLEYTIVGVLIAMMVLLPESIAAVRAALRDRVQISLNLGLGSAMASIGLTIPAVAFASIWAGPLDLGLGGVHLVLLATTAVTGILTLTGGRATTLQGGLHLTIFISYFVTSVSP
ncbi:MAG: ionic transporter y4hA [Corynebacteriales bacterium]|nr:ionic transporter y4hA [Mycobacteriales bacterium]